MASQLETTVDPILSLHAPANAYCSMALCRLTWMPTWRYLGEATTPRAVRGRHALSREITVRRFRAPDSLLAFLTTL